MDGGTVICPVLCNLLSVIIEQDMHNFSQKALGNDSASGPIYIYGNTTET